MEVYNQSVYMIRMDLLFALHAVQMASQSAVTLHVSFLLLSLKVQRALS